MGKDTVKLDSSNGVLVCNLPADATKEVSDFLKLQEQNRRERQVRIDAGDESVRIKFASLRQEVARNKAADDAKLKSAKEAALKSATPGVAESQVSKPLWQTNSVAKPASA